MADSVNTRPATAHVGRDRPAPPGRDRGGARRLPALRAGRATALTLALGTALASATVPGTAHATDADKRPAAYEAASSAKPVTGTASSADAPRLDTPGWYRDTIGRGEEKYYAVELDDSSTAYLAALAHPEPGTKVGGFGDGLRMELSTTDGRNCRSNGDAAFRGDGAAYPVGDHAARRIGGDDTNCQKAGPYLFKVTRKDEPTSDPADWPLEIRYLLEPGLKGKTPAAPADTGEDTEPPPPPGGEARKVDGGTGIGNAPAVGDGVWRDSLLPGETRFYRVPVDWGQQLFASVELPNAPRADDSDTSGSRFVSRALGANLFNPAGADLVAGNFTSYNGNQTAATLSTPLVAYGNRYEGGNVRDAGVAGWYTVAVTLDPALKRHFPASADITLRVRLAGEPQPAPAYDGDAAAGGFGVTDRDREAAEKGLTPAEAEATERGGARALLGWAAIGTGAALALGLLLWHLLARRRATTPP
ncbi:hypothetical protein GL263_02425, partial [Streptomyces durbertensis]